MTKNRQDRYRVSQFKRNMWPTGGTPQGPPRMTIITACVDAFEGPVLCQCLKKKKKTSYFSQIRRPLPPGRGQPARRCRLQRGSAGGGLQVS